MQNKKTQTSVGMMIQRCHKWRQKRKQYIDQARQTADEIERERLLQAAEHYGRIVNAEQVKIDSSRDPKEKISVPEQNNDSGDSGDNSDDDDAGFPEFITNLK